MSRLLRQPARRVAWLKSRIESEQTWHSLTTMRFLGHPFLSSVFTEYLTRVYHAMHTAGAVMEAARVRSSALAATCPVAARLADYWTQHLREEAGHDRWLMEDMRYLGLDLAPLSAPPAPEIAQLMGTMHFWILHTHPIAAVPYFYVVESSPPNEKTIDWLAEAMAIPREGLQTFYRHSRIDVAHARELEELIDSLPLSRKHEELMVLAATTSLQQLTRNLERLIELEDAAAASAATG